MTREELFDFAEAFERVFRFEAGKPCAALEELVLFARLSQKANEPITFAFDSAHACEFREDADFADRDQRFQREGRFSESV